MNQYQLPSCCGLEYLINNPARFSFNAGSITCNRSGIMVPVGSLPKGQLLCPCASAAFANLNNQTNSTRTVTVANWDNCLQFNNNILINGVCAAASSCPQGTSQQLQYTQGSNTGSNQSYAGICVAQGRAMVIYETLCVGKRQLAKHQPLTIGRVCLK